MLDGPCGSFEKTEKDEGQLTPVRLAVLLGVVHTDGSQPLSDGVGRLVHSQDSLAYTSHLGCNHGSSAGHDKEGKRGHVSKRRVRNMSG